MNDKRRTYGQFETPIDVADLLLGFCLRRPGDRVGIWAPNCHEWCLTQFATARIGAVLVNVNPAYRVFELEYALNKSGCRAIIAAEALHGQAEVRLSMRYLFGDEKHACVIDADTVVEITPPLAAERIALFIATAGFGTPLS